MTPLTCKVASNWLEAYHDGELTVGDQIAVAIHVECCESCALELADLQQLRSELRESAVGRLALSLDEAAVFESSVVKRAEVEAGEAFPSRVRLLFDDMHLVYAVLSAGVATLVFATIMFGTLRLATTVRSGSLGALVTLLSSPGSNENPVSNYGRVQIPRALDVASATRRTASEDDAVFALAAVVTREGRVSGVEFLQARGGKWVGEAGRIEGLMDAVAEARFAPAVSDEGPVAVNLVWLVANTTVRPDVPVPAPTAAPVSEPAEGTAEPVQEKSVA
jgi:anti-sigma factor RsiW